MSVLPEETVEVDIAGVFADAGYVPHAGQIPVHKAALDHRFRLASCGRRFGKSQIGGHELTVSAFEAYAARAQLSPKGRRHEYWIVGPEYSDAEKEFRVVYNDLLQLGMEFDRPGTYYSEGGGDMDISLFGGRFLVHAKSAKYPQTLVGEGLQGVIMAEAAKLKPVVWTKYIRPTLADYAREGSWALFSSTPEGKNWFYDLYMRGQSTLERDQQWFSIRRPSWTNDIVFPDGEKDPEIEEMRADMSSEKFKQEIEADFTEFVGRVFKDFTEETHVGDFEYNPRWPVYIAEDAGFTNPNVALFIQVDMWDNCWVLGEYYKRHRTPEEFAADVLEDHKLGPLSRVARKIYPDPADPGTAETLGQKWRVEVMGGTGGPRKDRLDLIRRWLKPQLVTGDAFVPDLQQQPTTTPKLMIDRSCTELIREMNDYRYPENKNEEKNTESEEPLKEDDHTPEALGRFFMGHFGQTHGPKAAARVARARMKTRTR